MILTKEQHDILARTVMNPQAWADHAEAHGGFQTVLQKVEKYRPAYEQAKQVYKDTYKTRAQRDVPFVPPPLSEKEVRVNTAKQSLAQHMAVYPEPTTLAVLTERVRLLTQVLGF